MMITRLLAEKPRAFDRLNKLMEEVFNGSPEIWTPLVDVKESPTELIFLAELPGMEKKDVDVELSGDVLTIRGSREYTDDERREDFVRIERGFGKFQRSFLLDTPVKQEAIQASFKDGVLKVVVPKIEDRPALHIPIRGA